MYSNSLFHNPSTIIGGYCCVIRWKDSRDRMARRSEARISLRSPTSQERTKPSLMRGLGVSGRLTITRASMNRVIGRGKAEGPARRRGRWEKNRETRFVFVEARAGPSSHAGLRVPPSVTRFRPCGSHCSGPTSQRLCPIPPHCETT